MSDVGIDNYADEDDFDDTPGEALGTSFRANWFRLIKDRHLPQESGKETWDFQRICTGFVALQGQRLGERQRRTA